jgi:hypothetical protein
MEGKKSVYATTSNEEITLKEGFTLRSLLAIIYTGLIIHPAVLWITLTANVPILEAAPYIVLLLFTEFALLWGHPLTKQESTIIFLTSFIAAGEAVAFTMPFYSLIYNAYFRRSPLTAAFGTLPYNIPDWFAPPPESKALISRTFMDPSWVIPIGITIITLILLKASEISIALFCRELFVKGERLPFPMAEVTASAAITLSEREPHRMNIFSLCAAGAFIYAGILYGVPIISQAALGFSLQPIPIPWVDLNYLLERYMPGASFGFSTDLLTLTLGFMLPFNVAASMFIGSFAIYVVGNYFALQYGLWPGWLPGMNVSDCWTRSMLYIWASPNIGMTIAVALLPTLRYAKLFARTFASIMKIGVEKKTGEISSRVYLSIFFACTIVGAILSHFLVPDFPIWIFFLLSVVGSFIISIVASRVRGLTGLSFNIPYISEILFLSSGYTGVDIWFVPVIMPTAVGGYLTQVFKVTELTGTKPASFVKAFVAATFVGVIANFIYTSIYWAIAEIPSAMYPATQIYWPTSVATRLLWVTRSLDVFKPDWIATGFIIGAMIFGVAEVFHLPISLVGLAAGMVSPIPNMFSIFMGAILGKILRRYIGIEWWDKNRAVLIAGFGCGEGIMVGIATGVAIAARAMWALPY